MTSETIKVLLMISLFSGLLATLHLPGRINSQLLKRWRRVTALHGLHSGPRAPISYVLAPVRAKSKRS